MATFRWDSRKARANQLKHGVSFAEAASAFTDASGLDQFDAAHSGAEDSWIKLGLSRGGQLLVVIYVEAGESIRIVSARRANFKEQQAYENDRRR